MARTLNKVQLIGNLGGDCEVRFTTGGTSVGNFNIATSRRWKSKDSDEWKEETDWHKIVFWNCEKVSEYLKKGKTVYIEGRLQTRSYEKDGEKRYSTEVVVENLILLGGKGEGGADAATKVASKPPARSAPAQHEIDDADVPF